jgi:hypothetical protein
LSFLPQATDKDEGDNSNIVYSIESGNDAGAFIIDPSTGVITTTDNISQLADVETSLTLTIAARDSSNQGSPKVAQQSATVTVCQTIIVFIIAVFVVLYHCKRKTPTLRHSFITSSTNYQRLILWTCKLAVNWMKIKSESEFLLQTGLSEY